MRYVRRKYNVLIGERTAEAIKKRIGAVYDHPQAQTVEVKGRCMTQGLPKVVAISSKEMIEALAEPITAILNAVCLVIERTPPELLGDILKNGIVMTGGGSLLYGFDQLLTRVTGTGCMTNSLIASALAVTDNALAAAVAGVLIMGLAGEVAHKSLFGSAAVGAFRVKLFDAVFALSSIEIEQYAKIEQGETL
jgi:actin-like ATPase involved in cell morphogenesis